MAAIGEGEIENVAKRNISAKRSEAASGAGVISSEAHRQKQNQKL